MNRIFSIASRRIFSWHLIFLLFWIGFVLGSCKKKPEEGILFLHCDHFNSSGDCLELRSETHTYKIRIPSMRPLSTWEDLSNYLYFYARETPGFVMKWNTDLPDTEWNLIQKTYSAEVHWGKTIEVMEGKEFGNRWLGSFQYLGSILKEEARRKNDLKDPIRLEKYFPAEMEFVIRYETPKKKIERREKFTIDLLLIE